jgi:predicted O-linked N-acetylglucosamine transferase (SPINDLY family)
MGDQAVVERILADEIDVLVDLGGHTDGSSLPIFAHRCAPVQVSFLAYPATTGMAEMDYKITDEWADPRGEVESYYSEKLWRLPRCAWAYEGVTDMRELVKQVAHDVPPAGELKLGAYNNLSKLDKPTARLWGRILSQIDPKIKLQLIDRRGISKDPESRKVLLADFEAGGVKDVEERLVFHPAAGGELEVLRRYGWIDLNLDPLGYSGTTTTCESLRFGVPTLTLPGRSHVSRVGYSLLHAVGLDEFVVRSEDEYVAKVVAWAKDPSPLRRLRGTLRTRLQESPLGDSRGLAKALEDAYEGMLKERLEAPPSMPGQVRFDLGGPSMGAVTFKMDG